MAFFKGIRLKKKFGQHFLRDERVVQRMLQVVECDETTSIFEIGCGNGFLTRVLLETPAARIWGFEIDPQWVTYLRTQYKDARLTVYEQNFLDVDWRIFEPYKPWTLLANLPYVITFPILYALQAHRDVLHEGVIMVQEEVAQKIVKQSGRDYGYVSLFFQHYFEWQLLDKIPPSAFIPPPKVYSRLLYFKPRTKITYIPHEEEFWQFIKLCFKQPRRTLRNNLQQTHYDSALIAPDVLALRAQQMTMEDFLFLWKKIKQ